MTFDLIFDLTNFSSKNLLKFVLSNLETMLLLESIVGLSHNTEKEGGVVNQYFLFLLK